jgi:hypothetical protein
MGFNLTSFAGGFAEAAVSSIEKEEAAAAARGTAGAKLMYENYKTVTASNKKLEGELKGNIETLKSYDKNATEDELYAIATKKPVMDYVLAQIKKENFDPETFKLSNIASITKSNVTSSALDRIRENLAMPKLAKDAATPFEYKDTGNLISDIKGSAGSRAAETSARQTAAALGVSYESLLAAQSYKQTDMTSDAVYNMGGVKLTKTPDQEIAAAQTKLGLAVKSGDEKGQASAKADLLIFKSVKDTMTNEQTKFASKISDIKNRYMFGTADERTAAKPEYDKLMSDIRNEAAAKKAGDGGDSKVPTLSALNTHTGLRVSRAISDKYGDMVKNKQIAFTINSDSSVSVDYIGDNAAVRREIQETRYEAAKDALSLYTDAQGVPLTKDVAAVINSFKPFNSAVPREAPVVKEKPALPPSKASSLGSASSGRAAAAPKTDVRAQAQRAIDAGANPAAVAKRFKETTGQDF